jgi:hypothetical protein
MDDAIVMKKLVDAFLELPTWEGVTLITAVVFSATYTGWRTFWMGYRSGRRDSEAEAVRVRDKRRDLESIA